MEDYQLGIYCFAFAVFLYCKLYACLVFLLVPLIWRKIYRFLPESLQLFIQRDLRGAKGAAMVTLISHLRSWDNKSVSDLFEATVRKYRSKPFFKYQDQEWTFQQIDNYANQVANYFFTVEKLKPGDCVALVATSCPQYVAIWLGLNKLGCVTALINCNLKDEPLRHAIAEAKSQSVIIGAGLLQNYLPIKANLNAIKSHLVFYEGHRSELPLADGLVCFDEEIGRMSEQKPVGAKTSGYFGRIVYIYTSGTTGLPKPCVITCHRMCVYIIAHRFLLGTKADDIIYCTLPLYHSAGGLICVGQGILYGSTIVLRKSFSASKFWEEVIKHRCTVFHYVGELCRYLLAQPEKPTDTQHSLRLLYGVGLRSQIWTQFVERFKIPRICEMYGSTEGNVGFANLDGHPGAIGFTSFFIQTLKQQYLIRTNMETGEPLRDKNGFCIKCKPDQAGELIGRITAGSKFYQFDGYVEKDATEKKQLVNVFRKGDLFFRTGDILVADQKGYVHFVDRTGDTFRWKGENVSTTEVEGVISKLVKNVDVAVFGVPIPGCEGKAGMACIAADDQKLDMQKLSEDIKAQLATYARPLFLRLVATVKMTETFKIQKGTYKEESFNIDKTGEDHLYFFNSNTGQYERLLRPQYEDILASRIRF